MKKTAIFVEGQTELVFVREYLLKMFGYQNISIECFTLFHDAKLHATEYPYQTQGAENYFQLLNVGNDNAVLTRLLRRETYLWNVGFHQIIALRDMYSKNYRELQTQQGLIDVKLNEEIISETLNTLKKHAKQPEKIDFCFAIMEVESWLLALYTCFEQLDVRLTSTYIHEQLGWNLEEIDPETTFFHPAKIMEDIYALVGQKYNKSKGNIEGIMATLQKEDFERLATSDKCRSFHLFHAIVFHKNNF